MIDLSEDNRPRLVALMIFGFLIFSVVNMLRSYYGFRIYSGDYAIFEQMFYHTLRGNWLYTTFEGGNHFGIHFSPILFLFVPLMAIGKSLYVAIAAQTTLTAIALWWFFKHNHAKGYTNAATLVTVMFILHSTLTHNTRNFYELALLPLPFVGAFINFEKERFRSFFIWLVVIGCIRENLFVMIGAWGLLSFSFGRRGRWVWGPLGLAVAHFFLANIITPRLFDTTFEVGFHTFYQGYGKTLDEIIANVIDNPMLPVAFFLKMEKAYYLKGILLPFLVLLPFLRRWWLPALPTLGYILFSTNSRVIVPTLHYSIEVVLWLGLSTLVFLRDQPAFFSRRGVQRLIGVLPLLVTAAFVYRTGDAAARLEANLNSERMAHFREIRAAIPQDAAVLANNHLANHLAQRDVVYLLHLKDVTTTRRPADVAILEHEPIYPVPQHWHLVKTAGSFRLFRIDTPTQTTRR